MEELTLQTALDTAEKHITQANLTRHPDEIDQILALAYTDEAE